LHFVRQDVFDDCIKTLVLTVTANGVGWMRTGLDDDDGKWFQDDDHFIFWWWEDDYMVCELVAAKTKYVHNIRS